mmetsp:Transcript_29772/g.60845  ORF Transcript_29772/g.60845 Transcript_29772/m.60845 type:complete len:207 (+) Transcript_29772:187-807(+)
MHLFRSEVSTLSEGKVREDLDRLLLLLHDGLDKILNGEHANHLSVVIEEGQVANVLTKHFGHACVDTVLRGGGDEVGGLCADLLDQGVLGILTKEGDLTNIVTLTDHTSDVALCVDRDDASDIERGKSLHGLVDGGVLADGVVDLHVATVLPGVGGHEILLDALGGECPLRVGVVQHGGGGRGGPNGEGALGGGRGRAGALAHEGG